MCLPIDDIHDIHDCSSEFSFYLIQKISKQNAWHIFVFFRSNIKVAQTRNQNENCNSFILQMQITIYRQKNAQKPVKV